MKFILIVGLLTAYGLIDASEMSSSESREGHGRHHMTSTRRPPMRPRMGNRGPMGGRGPMTRSGGKAPGSGGDDKGSGRDDSSSGGDDKGFIPGFGGFLPGSRGDGTFPRDDGSPDFTPWWIRRPAFRPWFYSGFSIPPFSPLYPRSFDFPSRRAPSSPWWPWSGRFRNSWDDSWDSWNPWESNRRSWSPFAPRRWNDNLRDSSYPDFLSLRSPQLPVPQHDQGRGAVGSSSTDPSWGRSSWADSSSWDSSRRIFRDDSRSGSRSSSWPWWVDGSRQSGAPRGASRDDHRWGHGWGHGWGSSSHHDDDDHHWGHWGGDDDHHGWSHWHSQARPSSWGGSWSRSLARGRSNLNESPFSDPFSGWFGRQAVAGPTSSPSGSTPVVSSTSSVPTAAGPS